MTTHPRADYDTRGWKAALVLLAVLGALVVVFAASLMFSSSAHAATVNSPTPTPSSSAPFEPIHETCLWQLTPPSTASDAFAKPQTLIACSTSTTPALPAPKCGQTITGQLDHYTITSQQMLDDFTKLTTSGTLASPAGDAEFSPADWSYPTLTGDACTTPTDSTTPPPSPRPIVTATSECGVGLTGVTVDNTNGTDAVIVQLVDTNATVPFSPAIATYTVDAGKTDVRDAALVVANVPSGSTDTFEVTLTGPAPAFASIQGYSFDVKRSCLVETTPGRSTPTPVASTTAKASEAAVATPVTTGTSPATQLALTSATSSAVDYLFVGGAALLFMGGTICATEVTLRRRRH